MRVLMLGWEFPPFISGGLGTACYGLTRAMSEDGIEVVFVLPRAVRSDCSTHVRLVAPQPPGRRTAHEPAGESRTVEGYRVHELENVTFVPVPVVARPYDTEASYAERVERAARLERPRETHLAEVTHLEAGEGGPDKAAFGEAGQYGRDLLTEVHRYARLLLEYAPRIDFDVIHAHDWMTYPAALAAKSATGKPLVAHVHSTEFDRSGEHINQRVYDIERAGLHGADHVICVSNLTRNICRSRYGLAPSRMTVVYNAVQIQNSMVREGPVSFRKGEHLVLFLGRITMQKGPEYFVAAAKKVLEKEQNVKFVMAGNGDMFQRVIELAAGMGIGHKILFTGFLRGDDVQKIFRMADLFVMPSVSEPFGLVPLEAMSQNVPVIISKQSGVSEVISHVLKVDFWDINEMANKIIAVLRHAPLRETLRKHADFEVRKFSWGDSARACERVYQQVGNGSG